MPMPMAEMLGLFCARAPSAPPRPLRVFGAAVPSAGVSSPLQPSMWSTGTAQPSKRSSEVVQLRIPSLSSFILATWKPGVPLGTTKARMALGPSSRSVVAKTTT
jgi:hypothetical protein